MYRSDVLIKKERKLEELVRQFEAAQAAPGP
jgi:hypothetical protein